MKKFHSALFDFCWFPNYDASIEYLANNIADPEPWDFSDATQAKYSILKSYIEHTFRKIKSENKISFSSDNNFACFNTGLVTANLESIFALAERNNKARCSRERFIALCFQGICQGKRYSAN